MISASDLLYFIEIANTANLSRAAERIGISQPSLTLAIKRIEDDLGSDIFIRSKKGVSLTKAGEHLLKHSRQMLQLWDQIKSEANSSTKEIKGTLTLGCHTSVGLYSLGKFIPSILKNSSELEFNIKHDLSRKITEDIISLKIDVGLVINPVNHPDLIIKKLIDDVVTLWKSKVQSPLTNTKDGSAVLICDPDLLQTQDILKKLKRSGHKFKRIVTSSSLENIASLVSAGSGVGILPTRVARNLCSKKITEIQDAPQFNDTLSVIYRMENKQVRSIQYLVSEIEKNLK